MSEQLTQINWMKLDELKQLPAFSVLFNGKGGSYARCDPDGYSTRTVSHDIQHTDKIKALFESLGLRASERTSMVPLSVMRVTGWDHPGALTIYEDDKGKRRATAALIDALDNARVFAAIGKALKEQKRDWKTQKNTPVVIEGVQFGEDFLKRALNEQGITVHTKKEREVEYPPLTVTIDDQVSLEALRKCLERCSQIQMGGGVRGAA